MIAGTDASTVVVLAIKPPVVTSFSKTTLKPGENMIVTGNYFLGATSVTLAGISVPYTVIDDTSISIAIPSNARSGSVQIKNGGGSSPLSGSIVIDTTPFAITSTSLSTGSQKVTYSQQLTASGGVGTLTWTRSAGGLPNGLSLSSTGVISGTPTVATYCFYDGNGTGYCIDPLMSSGYNGPYSACSLNGDCTATTYCYYDANGIYQSVCVPSGESPPNPSGSNYVASGAICNGIIPCLNPIDEGDGGPLSLSSSEATLGYKVCSSSFNPKKVNINSSFVAMCNWIISEYKKYKLGDIESKDKILKVWIEAFNTLENNKPLTSLVRIENVEMCKEAIQRYNILIVS